MMDETIKTEIEKRVAEICLRGLPATIRNGFVQDLIAMAVHSAGPRGLSRREIEEVIKGLRGERKSGVGEIIRYMTNSKKLRRIRSAVYVHPDFFNESLRLYKQMGVYTPKNTKLQETLHKEGSQAWRVVEALKASSRPLSTAEIAAAAGVELTPSFRVLLVRLHNLAEIDRPTNGRYSFPKAVIPDPTASAGP